MSESEAEQLALAGLAPRKRRKRVTHVSATERPIAQVLLDVQATHLGQTFDYLIDAKDDQVAQPGVLVRVRFGNQRLNGIIWSRSDASSAPASSLRYIERVLSAEPLVSASMRRDIIAIAEAYGGTPANILRLAVPPRVARIDQEQALASTGSWQGARGKVRLDATAMDQGAKRFVADYDGAVEVRNSLAGGGFCSYVIDSLPGQGRWAADLAWMAGSSLAVGRSAVLVLPTMREVNDVAVALRAIGLRPFAPTGATHGGYDGDFVCLAASLAPAERYRSYLAAASGQVRCVIGVRAAMYAPVEGPGLFAVVDDAAYQNTDGMMPYATARGVLRLRAKLHSGVFVAMGNARSVISQWELSDGEPATIETKDAFGCADGNVASSDGAADAVCVDSDGAEFGVQGAGRVAKDDTVLETGETDVPMRMPLSDAGTHAAPRIAEPPSVRFDVCETPVSGKSVAVHPYSAVVDDMAPWTRWFNRDELARLADPTIGARVPHSAVRILTQALETGPVLFSIPQDGVAEVLSCVRCHRQARCRRCTGPLQMIRGQAPRCRWCGAPASRWRCAECGSERMTVVRVGATGTAEQLRHLFGDMPMVLSSPSQPGGIVPSIPERSMIVIATPGAEPRVRGRGYAAVAILDAWTSLYSMGVDARLDTLTAWMRAAALCLPKHAGGQVLLIGESDPVLARSLIDWDCRLLACNELNDRAETGLPPAVAAACVWGRREAVAETLRRIGVTDGGPWSELPMPGIETPPDGVSVAGGTPFGDGSGAAYAQLMMPAVLGPVPIAQPRTVDARELDETRDRVKVVVRVPQRLRAELAKRLHAEVSRHMATRTPGELRFQLDPKDLT
jgi:primosomal protein N' (replication factor Y) (superfamily II helicase)